jgi:hypothetical protein
MAKKENLTNSSRQSSQKEHGECCYQLKLLVDHVVTTQEVPKSKNSKKDITIEVQAGELLVHGIR